MSSGETSSVKVVFRFFNTVLDEDYAESMWAQVIDQEQGLYQLDNVPFFVTSYSLGDIVLVETEDEQLIVKGLEKESGNSTLQIMMMQADMKSAVQQALEKLGCDWEESHLPDYFSVNVPSAITYAPVSRYLKKAKKQGLLAYREACLAHSTK